MASFNSDDVDGREKSTDHNVECFSSGIIIKVILKLAKLVHRLLVVCAQIEHVET